MVLPGFWGFAAVLFRLPMLRLKPRPADEITDLRTCHVRTSPHELSVTRLNPVMHLSSYAKFYYHQTNRQEFLNIHTSHTERKRPGKIGGYSRKLGRSPQKHVFWIDRTHLHNSRTYDLSFTFSCFLIFSSCCFYMLRKLLLVPLVMFVHGLDLSFRRSDNFRVRTGR